MFTFSLAEVTVTQNGEIVRYKREATPEEVAHILSEIGD